MTAALLVVVSCDSVDVKDAALIICSTAVVRDVRLEFMARTLSCNASIAMSFRSNVSFSFVTMHFKQSCKTVQLNDVWGSCWLRLALVSRAGQDGKFV